MTTTLHLVRHGEVENPKGVIYGRLPGYNLSERGQRQARETAQRLAERDIAAVWASPLERAQETAQAIAEPHHLEVVTDDRLLESETTLEGLTRDALHFFRTPKEWWHFRNPMKPSWGESFTSIRNRMLEAVREAVAKSEGREVVLVSHQTPVLVARLTLTRRRTPPWLGLTPCQTGSVTTLELEGEEKVVAASYFAPTGSPRG
ncbi:MAG: histidine phosphatase family protein [Actinomycetota bacterium]|nr:histidine phosphatase family protein [Actinomycetota bacterium]